MLKQDLLTRHLQTSSPSTNSPSEINHQNNHHTSFLPHYDDINEYGKYNHEQDIKDQSMKIEEHQIERRNESLLQNYEMQKNCNDVMSPNDFNTSKKRKFSEMISNSELNTNNITNYDSNNNTLLHKNQELSTSEDNLESDDQSDDSIVAPQKKRQKTSSSKTISKMIAKKHRLENNSVSLKSQLEQKNELLNRKIDELKQLINFDDQDIAALSHYSIIQDIQTFRNLVFSEDDQLVSDVIPDKFNKLIASLAQNKSENSDNIVKFIQNVLYEKTIVTPNKECIENIADMANNAKTKRLWKISDKAIHDKLLILGGFKFYGVREDIIGEELSSATDLKLHDIRFQRWEVGNLTLIPTDLRTAVKERRKLLTQFSRKLNAVYREFKKVWKEVDKLQNKFDKSETELKQVKNEIHEKELKIEAEKENQKYHNENNHDTKLSISNTNISSKPSGNSPVPKPRLKPETQKSKILSFFVVNEKKKDKAKPHHWLEEIPDCAKSFIPLYPQHNKTGALDPLFGLGSCNSSSSSWKSSFTLDECRSDFHSWTRNHANPSLSPPSRNVKYYALWDSSIVFLGPLVKKSDIVSGRKPFAIDMNVDYDADSDDGEDDFWDGEYEPEDGEDIGDDDEDEKEVDEQEEDDGFIIQDNQESALHSHKSKPKELIPEFTWHLPSHFHSPVSSSPQSSCDYYSKNENSFRQELKVFSAISVLDATQIHFGHLYGEGTGAEALGEQPWSIFLDLSVFKDLVEFVHGSTQPKSSIVDDFSAKHNITKACVRKQMNEVCVKEKRRGIQHRRCFVRNDVLKHLNIDPPPIVSDNKNDGAVLYHSDSGDDSEEEGEPCMVFIHKNGNGVQETSSKLK
eukprot:gb/GECH01000885.1/.p1 GENE.gb/GECH01000885.1/~~gb/GECH01000885.1/.p1  ORF type:complete len:857 (+),score=263.34 gb/GECH01000885.1/:1-2571(+)